jgi:hypothetical protein
MPWRLTTKLAQMIKKGWSEDEALKFKAEGYSYSLGRDSLLGQS